MRVVAGQVCRPPHQSLLNVPAYLPAQPLSELRGGWEAEEGSVGADSNGRGDARLEIVEICEWKGWLGQGVREKDEDGVGKSERRRRRWW